MEYKYMCNKCGKEWLSNMSDDFGPPSCECGGEGIRMVECAVCHQEYAISQTSGYCSTICNDCIDDCKNDMDTCYKIGKKDTETIKINALLATVFEKEDIEEILYEELAKIHNKIPLDFTPFINADRDWFADCLEEEVTNGENT